MKRILSWGGWRGPCLAPALLVLANAAMAGEPPVRVALEPGARVRLTAFPSIHVPDLVDIERGHIRARGARVVAADGRRVLLERPDGTRFAVPDEEQRLEGRLVAVEPDAFVIESRKAGERLTVPRAAIARVEVSAGRRSRLAQAAIGLLIGAGVGAGAGAITGTTCHPNEWFCSPGFNAVALAALGAPIGLLSGLAMPVERWKRVDEPPVQLRLGPARNGGPGVALELSF